MLEYDIASVLTAHTGSEQLQLARWFPSRLSPNQEDPKVISSVEDRAEIRRLHRFEVPPVKAFVLGVSNTAVNAIEAPGMLPKDLLAQRPFDDVEPRIS
jgi:hypothetical protein